MIKEKQKKEKRKVGKGWESERKEKRAGGEKTEERPEQSRGKCFQ